MVNGKIKGIGTFPSFHFIIKISVNWIASFQLICHCSTSHHVIIINKTLTETLLWQKLTYHSLLSLLTTQTLQKASLITIQPPLIERWIRVSRSDTWMMKLEGVVSVFTFIALNYSIEAVISLASFSSSCVSKNEAAFQKVSNSFNHVHMYKHCSPFQSKWEVLKIGKNLRMISTHKQQRNLH